MTGTNGTGSTEFDVLDATENAALGCSSTVACSLVAVPVMGINCDAEVSPAPTAAELAQCEATGASQPGAVDSQPGENPYDLTVSGFLWWSPSNWQNRITVPLTFAPAPGDCPVVSSNNTVTVDGSELLVQATSQWVPYFCLGDDSETFTVDHDAMGDPQARDNLANGSVEAAFTSDAQPLGYGRPVVNAPVAVTGFTISFSIDGADGEPITTLELTPLLLAKLLTNSYPVLLPGEANPALDGNPLNITDDPEFEALNPGIPQDGTGYFDASELVSMSEGSDVIEALTSYINDDPAARAWLNGTSSGEPAVCNSSGVYQAGATDACPAMKVNPAYQGISLPVDQWPLLSTWEWPGNAQVQYCLQEGPEPFDTMVAAPLGALEDVSQSMQFHDANSTTTCTPDAPDVPNSLTATGTQAPGQYFMIGITPLADDDRYGLQAAELQTTSGTFVAPSDASLEVATDLLQPDPTTGTWPIPYNNFETPAGVSAYPGTLVVYAAVPTSGLSAADATDYAALLTFAAGPGQTPGSGVGQLPSGYLPLTAADGLGGLAAYTLAAAKDVAAQNGQVPPLTPAAGGSSSDGSGASGGSLGSGASGGSSSSGSGGSSGLSSLFSGSGVDLGPLPLSGSDLSTGATSASAGAAAHHRAARQPLPILPLGSVADVALWTSGLPVVLILGLALLVALAVPATYLLGRRRGRW